MLAKWWYKNKFLAACCWTMIHIDQWRNQISKYHPTRLTCIICIRIVLAWFSMTQEIILWTLTSMNDSLPFFSLVKLNDRTARSLSPMSHMTWLKILLQNSSMLYFTSSISTETSVGPFLGGGDIPIVSPQCNLWINLRKLSLWFFLRMFKRWCGFERNKKNNKIGALV